MIKNDLKLNMLFIVLAFFVTACSVNNRSVQKKSPSRTSNTNYLRNKIENFAKKQIGVKYKYAGKNPRGFDCSGFTSYVFREFDVQLSASSKLQSKQGKRVNLKWVKKGDLLFFGSGGKISHVALVVDNQKAGIYVIHSTSSRGVIVENVSRSTYWKKRMMFARNVLD